MNISVLDVETGTFAVGNTNTPTVSTATGLVTSASQSIVTPLVKINSAPPGKGHNHE